MQIATLTTDFGWKDYYVGVLKGSILSVGSPLVLADITHDVEPFNIAQAAFIVKNAYKSFPKGSIHLLCVHSFYAPTCRYIAAMYQQHYFLAPDNGIFSLLFDEAPQLAVELPAQQANSIGELSQVFARAIGGLLQQRPLGELGQPAGRLLQRISIQPIIGKNTIRGSVLHIDHYENVLLNIDRALFERVGKGRAFELYFKRYDPITALSRQYADVPVGEVLCMFNSAGFLEIAINADRAASLLGLRVDDTVQIDFLD